MQEKENSDLFKFIQIFCPRLYEKYVRVGDGSDGIRFVSVASESLSDKGSVTKYIN